MNIQKKVWTATVIKSLPDDLAQDSDGLWAYASVEVPDAMGDVVRCDGMDWTDYHRPEDGVQMKILASHLRVLPDGSPPVVGRVERFQRMSTPDGVPAVAFFMSWAKDGEGQITDLARKYKQLYDGGYLDSFSIGASVLKRSSMKDGGYDYQKTRLEEISAVTIPANQRANVMRALEVFGQEIDRDAVLLRTLEDIYEKVQAPSNPNIDIEGLVKSLDEALARRLDPLVERLDFLESSLVVKSEGSPPTDDRKGEEFSKSLASIRLELERLSKTMS